MVTIISQSGNFIAETKAVKRLENKIFCNVCGNYEVVGIYDTNQRASEVLGEIKQMMLLGERWSNHPSGMTKHPNYIFLPKK